MRNSMLWSLILVLLASCQSFAVDDVPATLNADMVAYSTDVALLREQAQVDRTVVAATVSVAETRAAGYQAYNSVLIATARADQAPTPEKQAAVIRDNFIPPEFQNEMGMSGGGSTSLQPEQMGDMAFNNVLLTDTIDGNRCPGSPVSSFPTSEDIIYLTTTAENLQPDTRITVNWAYEGTVVYQVSWTSTQAATNICVAMEFWASNAPFRAGNWQATLLVNGTSIQAVPFSMFAG